MAFKVHYFKTQEAILRVLDQADTKASSDRWQIYIFDKL